VFIEVRDQIVRETRPVLMNTWTLRPSQSPLVMPGGKVARYRSWFGYTAQTAEIIRRQRSTAGLKGLPVWTDEVVLDIDSAEQVAPARDQLIRAGVRFTEWNARRGRHFHIPIRMMWGDWVVHSVRMWAFSILDPEQFDHSMINESGQIRAQFSVHDKDPSVIKFPIREYAGKIPSIEFKQPPPKVEYHPIGELTADTEYDFMRQLEMTRTAGNRTMHLFIIARAGIRAGLGHTAVIEAAKMWNRRYARPSHPDRYVEDKITEVYRASR
jgi:hypothetical protein